MIDRAALARALKTEASGPTEPVEPAPGDGRANDSPIPPGVQRGFRAAVAVIAVVGLALLIGSVVAHRTRGGSVLTNDAALAWAITGAVLMAVGTSALLLRPEAASARRQIASTGVWTLALLVGLIALWWLIDHSTRQDEWIGRPVFGPADVNAFLNENPDLPPIAAVGDGGPPLHIPTGVMLQSAEFLSGSNVRVTGYVWQKYPSDLPDDVERGIVLPDALSEAYQAQEAYRHDDGETETVGWYIAATLRQAFDVARYPFDRPNVWLRLWARDFDHNQVLVPDFAAYREITPAAMPGVEGSFVFGNWDPAYSGWSYDLAFFNADFGIPADDLDRGDPELYFNLVLKRDPLGPASDFIAYSLTVALLSFGLLALTSANPDVRGRFGISTAGVLGSVSVLLFGVISKQSGLRLALDTQQLTYLEALPILLYVMLLLTALNAILVCAPFNLRILEYRDNLLPELLYWPILLTLLFVVTLAVFFT
jgi:hypothetical protein